MNELNSEQIQRLTELGILGVSTLSDCLRLFPEYSMSRLRDKVTISCKTLKGDLRLSYSGDSELECAYELLKNIYILKKNEDQNS